MRGFKFSLLYFFSRKTLPFVISLLFIITLFSSSLVSGFYISQRDIDVYSEVELREAINAAPDNKYYEIVLKNELTLKTPLEIPKGKQIGLLDGRLVGGNGVDTIIVKSGGELHLWGVVVTHAKGTSGRGVYVESGGIFTLFFGEIYGNSATKGGGVYNEGTFTLYGKESIACFGDCIISDNKADYGGGVYNVGSFITYSGEISNNTAIEGQAVYNIGTFDRSDRTLIYSTAVTSGESADVFIKPTSGRSFYLLPIAGTVAVVSLIGASLFFYRSKTRKPLIAKSLGGVDEGV
ncbi:MAG: hypothetical protein FWD52_02225 [Candidatus Bathyarchaeota archaeon]|nr:hypothetical protein [Candidatus Termiticorpusculum sp.]